MGAYAIYYININLSLVELSYMVTKKEFLAIMYAINKFWNYITDYTFFVHTDHFSIKYLMNKPITNRRITRWFLLLQEFEITIIDKRGKDNLVVHFFSRLTNNSDDSPITYSFLDENLFVVSTHTPWYVNITNYLVAGKLLHHLSSREQ